MQRCLVVDDQEEDRRSLRRLVCKEVPGVQLTEAANVGQMFAHLGPECDLLFVDVCLEPRNGNNDSRGLVAMYDVVDSYPGVPIVVVSAHGAEKFAEIVRASLKCRSVVGFLDKGKYGPAEVAEVVQEARTFKERWRYERGKPDFVNEVFAEAERRADQKIEEYEKKAEKGAARARLYEEVLHGTNWIQRAEAERRISQGQCDVTAYLLAREVEKEVRKLFGGAEAEGSTFFKRLEWIKRAHGLAERDFWRVNAAWSCRNAVVHGARSATLSDVRQLNDALGSLRQLGGPSSA